MIHAGTLVKCASEQLRYSSERARQLANVGQDGWLRKGQYEDLSMDAPPDEDKTDDELEGLDFDSSAAWEYETRQVKRKLEMQQLEMQPSSSSSLARPRGDAVLSQTDEKPVHKVSKQPAKYSRQESRALKHFLEKRC